MSINKNRVVRDLIKRLEELYPINVTSRITPAEDELINHILSIIEGSVEIHETLDVDLSNPQPDSDFDDEDSSSDISDSEENDEQPGSQEIESLSQQLMGSFPSQPSSSSSYEPSPIKKPKIENFEPTKMTSIMKALADHPNWTFETFEKKYSISRSQFYNLKKKVNEQLPSYPQAFKDLNSCVYLEFLKRRNEGQPVHDRDLAEIALSFAKDLKLDDFKASSSWIYKFKSRHNIGQRKIMHFRTRVQIRDWELIRSKGEQFVKEVNEMLEDYPPPFIFNTDQSGFSIETHRKGTLEVKGTKDVIIRVGNLNALKNIYTSMPTLSLDGTLTSKLFLVLKETSGKIPFTLRGKVSSLVSKLGNVYVTANKTGKMTYAELELYLRECFFPSTGPVNLLICDSWTPFLKKNNFIANRVPHGKRIDIMNIPGKTTSERQPLDRGYFLTLKAYVKKISDHSLFDEDFKAKLHGRMTIILLQSVAHNQFSSPRFQPWLQKAWFYCGYDLIKPQDCENPYKFAFNRGSKLTYCSSSDCGKLSFIKCTWCCKICCFEHFFNDEEYHFATCKEYMTL